MQPAISNDPSEMPEGVAPEYIDKGFSKKYIDKGFKI
jgi:hypothetical protein